MAKYRKKPVVIEAWRWDGGNPFYMPVQPTWLTDGMYYKTTPEGKEYVVISTLEGDMSANPGDWIIRGIKSEFYPCKPDIFEATYEPV